MEKNRFSGVIACNGSIAQVAPCGAGDTTGTIGPVLTHAELGHEGLNDHLQVLKGISRNHHVEGGIAQKSIQGLDR